MSETNYEFYFGTLKRAAWTVSQMCGAIDDCDLCPLTNEQGCPEWTLARARKWLERDADDE